MFALIFIGVFVVSLVVIILTLLEKNHDLQIDNEKLSHQTTQLLLENSKLRKELNNVLQIEPERTRKNKKSTRLYHN